MSKTSEAPTHPEIWREGDRVVSDLCGGFWDLVPDTDLERYAADESSHALDRAFAAATLAIRRYERLAQEERVQRLARSWSA
jgi:hypothetical protein